MTPMSKTPAYRYTVEAAGGFSLATIVLMCNQLFTRGRKRPRRVAAGGPSAAVRQTG